MGARGRQSDPRRELDMCNRYRAGETLQEIGTSYGLTRERVRQLISKHGLTSEHGGQYIKTAPSKFARAHAVIEHRRAKLEARYQRNLGCSADTFVALTGCQWSWSIHHAAGAKNPGVAYINQKRTAGARSIEWAMTFPEWWAIWQDSGKWELRGRGQGYCMARHGDSGSYAPENVYICTVGQNFSDSYLIHPWAERFAKAPWFLLTRPRDELGLTALQRRVYDLRIQGITQREIGARLGISAKTVSTHIYEIRKVRHVPRFDSRGRMIEAVQVHA